MRRYIYDGEIDILDDGSIASDTAVWSDFIHIRNQYLQTGLKGDFMTGMAKHNYAVSVDRSHRKMYKKGVDAINPATGKPSGTFKPGSSIYDGIILNPWVYQGDISSTLTKNLQHEETDVSLNFMDKIEVGKLTLLAAASRRHGDYVRGTTAKQQKNNVKDNNCSG